MFHPLLNHPTSYLAGMLVCLSLIMAIGPQNLHMLRMAIERRHIAPTLAVTVAADVVLIAIGIAGMGALVSALPGLRTLLVLGGVAFLARMGWGAAQRLWMALRAGPRQAKGVHPLNGQPLSRRQAVTTAVAFTWFNPHAWLDAAVLLGSAALAHGAGQVAFGAGAATASLLWFCALAMLGWWLGPRAAQSRRFQLGLDAAVVLIMWGTAAQLLWGLVIPGSSPR